MEQSSFSFPLHCLSSGPNHFCSRLLPQLLKGFSLVSPSVCYSHHCQSDGFLKNPISFFLQSFNSSLCPTEWGLKFLPWQKILNSLTYLLDYYSAINWNWDWKHSSKNRFGQWVGDDIWEMSQILDILSWMYLTIFKFSIFYFLLLPPLHHSI